MLNFCRGCCAKMDTAEPIIFLNLFLKTLKYLYDEHAAYVIALDTPESLFQKLKCFKTLNLRSLLEVVIHSVNVLRLYSLYCINLIRCTIYLKYWFNIIYTKLSQIEFVKVWHNFEKQYIIKQYMYFWNNVLNIPSVNLFMDNI